MGEGAVLRLDPQLLDAPFHECLRPGPGSAISASSIFGFEPRHAGHTTAVHLDANAGDLSTKSEIRLRVERAGRLAHREQAGAAAARRQARERKGKQESRLEVDP